MSHHHDALITFPLAVVALVGWWFLPLIEETSHWVAIFVPFVTLVVLLLQGVLIMRKLRR